MQEDNRLNTGTFRDFWHGLEHGKRTWSVVLAVVSLAILVFSVLLISDRVQDPFRKSLADLRQNKNLLKDPAAEAEAKAKRTDTDGDGLSDWAEENVYKTSPYLWSTAGDNVPDNVKIAMGANPLCKLGEPCTAGLAMRFDLPTTTIPFADAAGSGNTLQENLNGLLAGKTSAGQAIQQKIKDAGVQTDIKSAVPRDAALIRKALIDSGKVTQEKMDTITDDQLLQMYDESVKELQQEQAAAASTTPSTPSPL